MQTYNPLLSLLLFLVIATVLFFLFQPKKGWFWIIKNNYKPNKKVIAEDILKFLFHSESEGKTVYKIELFEFLKIKNSIITKVIDIAVSQKLISIENKLVQLTLEGRKEALRIIRTHRLWEKFLAEKTGYDKIEWHERAERKEHELDVEQVNLLASKLGQPQFDPHGDPIPSQTGKMPVLKGVSLTTLPVYFTGKIVHIEDEPEVVYKQILAENIHIGSILKVLENNKTRITFYSEGEEYRLSPEVAENLTIAVFQNDIKVEHDLMRLTSLKENETATIIGLSKESRGDSRRRLLDLGFVKGASVSIDLVNPLKEPTAYLIKGTSIALRNNQASYILIKKDI
ncbi:MAG: metal-dependent transcriptional regulator [Lutibacter sp.]|uniref:metal-dependent transcriptional regulator n=1 Tax=Lutibacter sp. TaxID=1925666 RepID=UPI00385CAA99